MTVAKLIQFCLFNQGVKELVETVRWPSIGKSRCHSLSFFEARTTMAHPTIGRKPAKIFLVNVLYGVTEKIGPKTNEEYFKAVRRLNVFTISLFTPSACLAN